MLSTKLSQRILSLLLVFAVLSAVFSVGVSAEDITAKDFKVKINTRIFNDWTEYNYTLDVLPNNGTREYQEYVINNGIPSGTSYVTATETFLLEYANSDPLLKKDRKSSVKLNNAYINLLLTNDNAGVSKYDKTIDSVRALVYYSDGTFIYIDDVTVEKPSSNGLHNFSIEFTPEKDVNKIEFITTNKATLPSGGTVSSHTKATVYVGELDTANMALTITIQSEEASLLGGIIDWLKGIKNGITDLFNSIKDLPSNIWNLISSGLQSLFVPSNEFIVEFKDEVKTLLADRLGAVYQVVDISFESWDKVKEYDSQNKISIPRISTLLAGTRFTLGPYEVDIVPKGMEYLAGMVKVAIGITATMAFVGGLKKRYEEIISK